VEDFRPKARAKHHQFARQGYRRQYQGLTFWSPKVNGEPCSGSRTLLTRILREERGFQGYVVSDCGAMEDFHAHHSVTQTPEQSAAMAVQGGCDLECRAVFSMLVEAYRPGLISEAEKH
jgi:beta-glucosidase